MGLLRRLATIHVREGVDRPQRLGPRRRMGTYCPQPIIHCERESRQDSEDLDLLEWERQWGLAMHNVELRGGSLESIVEFERQCTRC